MKVKDGMLQEVLDRIEKKYGDLDDICGCNVHTDHGYEWLSIANIVEIIIGVDEDYE